MEETTFSVKKYILTYGIILGVIWVIYGFFRHVTYNRATSNWAFSIFELSLHIGFLVYGIYKYKSDNNGFLTLLQALKTGFGIALISTIIQTIGDIFLVKIISPEIIHEIMNLVNQATEQASQEQSKISSKDDNYFFNVSFGLIVNLVLGIVISLFAGAIMQKNRNPF